MLQSDDIRTLTDIGFIAASRGLATHAQSIFEAIQKMRPEQEAGFIGQALVDMLQNRPDAAAARLRRLPPSDAARTFLGLALMQQGVADEARRILEDVAGTAGDTPFGKLARQRLEELPR